MQQNKAKVDVLDPVNERICLWKQDYRQKVLPMQFLKRQCSYFGEKGMSLHVDVFLMQSKQNDGKKFTFFLHLQVFKPSLLNILCILFQGNFINLHNVIEHTNIKDNK